MHIVRCVPFCSALLLFVSSSSVVAALVAWLLSGVSAGFAVAVQFSAPVELSDSGRSGSRADQGPESASTQPACPHARGSASDKADSGGPGKLQYLPSLWGG